MALTQTEVSQLFVSLFGRASEGDGNAYWMEYGENMVSAANEMLATDAAKEYFGDTIDDNQAFIEFIYLNTLGKTIAEDPDGIAYWVAELESGVSQGQVSVNMIAAAQSAENAGDAQDQFNNKVLVSNNAADMLAEFTTIEAFTAYIADVDHTQESVDAATDAIADDAPPAPPGETFTLTNDTDVATANIFDAPMVYTPDGSDRILSLQDEDILTGTDGRSDNTLNAVLGQGNADEGDTLIRTPKLNNIQVLNLDVTGNANTFDARFSDSLEEINVNKITQAAGGSLTQNILTTASVLSVNNTLDNNSVASFDYVRGVLAGDDDTLDLTLDRVLAQAVETTAGGGQVAGTYIAGNSALNEGFETVNLAVSNNVDLRAGFYIEDMENLNITGTGTVDILNQVRTVNEFDAFNAAIVNGGSVGQRTIDANAFTGELNIDISLNVGRQVDPNDSGAPFYGVTTGGTGNDKFHTNVAIASVRTETVHNMIDGGAGENTLVSYVGGIDDGSLTSANSNIAEITNIQTLELRHQTATVGGDLLLGTADDVAGAALGTVDMDAFDSALTSVLMRDEDIGITTFDLDDVSAELGADGLTLQHGISVAGAPVVQVELKDGTGADDTVALEVINGLNTGNTFNYTLTADGFDTDGIAGNVNTGVAATSDADAIENITLHDNDTESNVATLTNIINHTGTTTLDGGTAGKTFTVAATLNSAVVDASAQLSNLRLTVGDTVGAITTITQDVKLGMGDDVLTFANIDELDATDSLTDAGGNDTVRAIFSKDSALDIAGIENLHIAATANVELGMAKADVTNLVILSDTAIDNTGGVADLDNNGVVEPFGIVLTTANTEIITLDSSSLTQLNFFGDADNLDQVIPVDEVFVHTFNGVTLANNTATDISVNINTSLDANQTPGAAAGATAYTIGKLTTHGNNAMDIVVGNERIDDVFNDAQALTTINNIYAKAMTSLTATTVGDLNLGTVSGDPLANSLTNVDMTGVGGDVTARVISLGDNATVALGDGINWFDGLGSAGKGVTITSGDNLTLTGGVDTVSGSYVRGTAQDDTITVGKNNDTVDGDDGDNVIRTNAGSDFVTTKEGNDTVDLGTGGNNLNNYVVGVISAAPTVAAPVLTDTYIDNIGTGTIATAATNTVSLSGGTAVVQMDTLGDGTINALGGIGTADDDVDQVLAVAAGSDLTVSWLGGTMNAAGAVLDGALATISSVTTPFVGGASNDLYIVDTVNGTFNGGLGNDVAIVVNTIGAANDSTLTFSGGAGNDTAVGGDGNDTLTGEAGNDLLIAGAGVDNIDGGSGNDIINFGANLLTTDTVDGGSDTDTLMYADAVGTTNDLANVTNVEKIVLGATIVSEITVDALVTLGTTLTIDATAAVSTTLDMSGELDGNFAVLGSAGIDTLTAGNGVDTFTGNLGADVFNFATGNTGITLATADTITDFSTAAAQGDTIGTFSGAGNATIADGSAYAAANDLGEAAFIAAATAAFGAADTPNNNDVFVAWNAAGTGNAYVAIDENDNGAVDAGDTLLILTGINTAAEIVTADFV